MNKVLEGIRVLDLGRFIAGPFCAALLGDFGADVIRVDRPGGSEDRFIVPVTERGEGALFLQCNRNKRSIALDLDSPAGRGVLRDLVERADVVVANMPAGTLASLGIDYASLKAIKPDIILTAASAFGTHPALRDKTGFDGAGQAMSGVAYIGGPPEHPMKAMVPVIDFGTAMASAMGTIAALYERRASGVGQEVVASLLHTGLTYASGTLIEESALRLDRGRTSNRSPSYGPSDMFRAQDGWIMVQVIGEVMFRRWSRMIGQPELADDPRFEDDFKRGENGELLSDMMARWCAGRTREDALAELAKVRIPAASVNSPREALADAAIGSSGAFQWTGYPGLDRPVPLVTPPVSLSRTSPAIERRAPTAGEHTDEILRELGYTPRMIEDLHAQGVC